MFLDLFEHVSFAVLEAEFMADLMADRCFREGAVTLPHDLVSGLGIMGSPAVSAEVSDEAHGVAEGIGGVEPALDGIMAQKVQFVIGEQEVGVAIGNLTAEQGHHHNAPGDDGVDGDGALQAIGGAEHQELGSAA